MIKELVAVVCVAVVFNSAIGHAAETNAVASVQVAQAINESNSGAQSCGGCTQYYNGLVNRCLSSLARDVGQSQSACFAQANAWLKSCQSNCR